MNNAEKVQNETYPRAFIEWLIWGDHPFVSVYDSASGYFTDEFTDERYNIKQLYNIWLEENKPEDMFKRLADIFRPGL